MENIKCVLSLCMRPCTCVRWIFHGHLNVETFFKISYISYTTESHHSIESKNRVMTKYIVKMNPSEAEYNRSRQKPLPLNYPVCPNKV